MGKGKSVCNRLQILPRNAHGSVPWSGSITLQKITAGDKEAWTGKVTGNTQIYVDNPDLFGGEKKEGGVQGYVDIMMGGAAQPQNDYLVSKISTILASL
jgi:hypothetical protein